jgi:hypothetical protein
MIHGVRHVSTGTELKFALFRRTAMSDAEFAADIEAVTRDLAALRELLEKT